MNWSLAIAAVVGLTAAYLIGGIPFGLLIGRMHGIDVRTIGSGNIGATNVGRALGKKWWITVFLLDALKGALPVLLMRPVLSLVVGSEATAEPWTALVWLLTGVVAVLGHNYPVYLGFKGGKGVSTSLGAALAVYPDFTLPALIGLGVWILLIVLTRISSLGSILGALAFPVAYVWLAGRRGPIWPARWPYLVFAILLVGMLIYRHRANIALLFSGRERLMNRLSTSGRGRADEESETAGDTQGMSGKA